MANNTNNQESIKEKVSTITYNKEDIEKIVMALNQISVIGYKNVCNLSFVFEVLDKNGKVNN